MSLLPLFVDSPRLTRRLTAPSCRRRCAQPQKQELERLNALLVSKDLRIAELQVTVAGAATTSQQAVPASSAASTRPVATPEELRRLKQELATSQARPDGAQPPCLHVVMTLAR